MKTVLVVKLGLLPLLLLWALLAAGLPAAAAVAVPLGVAALVVAWNRPPRPLDLASLAILGLLAAATAMQPGWVGRHATAVSLAGLGLFSLASAALGRPWTADYARAAFADSADTALFHRINQWFTVLWGGLFLVLAAAHATRLGPAWTAGIVAGGIIASAVGPTLLVRAALRRVVAARQTYRWPSPVRHRPRPAETVDVAVVGAGIGGLTAAALLAEAGLKVVVAEAQAVPGGYCQSWTRTLRRDGGDLRFRFDAGVHDVSGVRPDGSVGALLARLGAADAITWLRLDHCYRIDGRETRVPRDWQAYVVRLAADFPGEAGGIAALFADVRAVFDAMYESGAANGGMPLGPASVADLLAFARRFPVARRWMNRPFAELVATHVADPGLRRQLAILGGYLGDDDQHLTVGEMAPIYGYYFFGGYYPAGGSGRLAAVLAQAITDRGGVVRLGCPVRRIVAEGGRACGLDLDGGGRIEADAVISGADLRATLLDLVEPGQLPAGFRDAIRGTEPSASAFLVQLGLDVVPDVPPFVLVDRADGVQVGVVLPSLLDPPAAPPGYATMELITLLPPAEARSWFPGGSDAETAAWRRSPEYAARKAAMGDRLIAVAEEVAPGLARHIVFRADSSPVTFRRYGSASAGAIYGCRAAPTFRGAKTPLPGLAIAGAATHGPGIEAVVLSGAAAAEALVPGLLRGGRGS